MNARLCIQGKRCNRLYLRVGLDAAKRKIPSCGESIPNSLIVQPVP